MDDIDDKIVVLRRGAPPPTMSFEDFRDSFGLNGTGSIRTNLETLQRSFKAI